MGGWGGQGDGKTRVDRGGWADRAKERDGTGLLHLGHILSSLSIRRPDTSLLRPAPAVSLGQSK